MSGNWLTFKSNLDKLGNISVSYVDDEGSKILIDSEIEFQEAWRFARKNGKNHLQLILTVDKLKTNARKTLEKKKIELNSASLKESSCQCPEWFSHYMKKFKKSLMNELKSSIQETVHNAVEKEMALLKGNQKSVNLTSDVKNLSSSPVNKKKKKKRTVDKDCGEQWMKQREVKLLKKMKKLQRSKFEKLESKLEKLDNKTRMLLEERKKLLESKRSKLEKKSSLKNLRARKSAVILGGQIRMKVPPGGKFTKAVSIMNNGAVQWTRAHIEGSSVGGIVLKTACLGLPSLKPGNMCTVKVEGRVTENAGAYFFNLKVVDESEELSPPMTFWAEVFAPPPDNSPLTTSQVFSSIIEENTEGQRPSSRSVKELIDFEDDVITTSQKKIEENIMEIQRRLLDIDLCPFSIPKADLRKKSDCGVDFPVRWPQTSENLKLAEGGDLTKQDHCDGFIKSNGDGEAQDVDDDSDSEKAESLKNEEGETQSDSDSELSVIYVSEEEDNFIVVPLPSESPSPEPPKVRDEKRTGEGEAQPEVASEAGQEVTVEEPATKEPETESWHEGKKEEEESKKEVSANEESFSSQSSSTRSRRSPSREESTEFKSKKIKSSRATEYQFTAANLTQPSFYPRPEKGEAFTFTAETSKKQEEVSKRRRDVPKIDSSGKVIFAVNTNGYCLPVESLLEDEGPKRQQSPEAGPRTPKAKERKWGRGERMNRRDRPNDRVNEAPAVSILPNVLMNGASNMASLAISTAKSVINNFQSAFVTEGKTEMGKPVEESSTVSTEAMFWLYEMGFRDLQMNRRLLEIYDNDLAKVIEEIVLLQGERSPNERK